MGQIVIYQGKKADAFKTRIRLIAKAYKMTILDAMPDDDSKELKAQVDELSNMIEEQINLNSDITTELSTLKDANIRLIEEKKKLTDKVNGLEEVINKVPDTHVEDEQVDQAPIPEPEQTKTSKRK